MYLLVNIHYFCSSVPKPDAGSRQKGIVLVKSVFLLILQTQAFLFPRAAGSSCSAPGGSYKRVYSRCEFRHLEINKQRHGHPYRGFIMSANRPAATGSLISVTFSG